MPISLTFDNGDEVSGTSAGGQVLYAGGASGSVAGLLHLNVRVPPDALAGNAVAFALIIGRDSVPGSLTIALR